MGIGICRFPGDQLTEEQVRRFDFSRCAAGIGQTDDQFAVVRRQAKSVRKLSAAAGKFSQGHVRFSQQPPGFGALRMIVPESCSNSSMACCGRPVRLYNWASFNGSREMSRPAEKLW